MTTITSSSDVRYCRFCGASLPVGEKICQNCGRIQARPLGVTAISILAVVGGVLALLAGVALIVASGFLTGFFPLGFVVVYFQVLAASIAVAGVVLITSGGGLLKLKLWGWWLAVMGSAGSIAFNIYSSLVTPLIRTPLGVTAPTSTIEGALPGIVIALIIIGYLLARRGFFGKVTAISKPRLIGLAVLALLPLILLGIGFVAVAPLTIALPPTVTLPPEELGWREVETLSGTGNFSKALSVGSEFRVFVHVVGVETLWPNNSAWIEISLFPIPLSEKSVLHTLSFSFWDVQQTSHIWEGAYNRPFPPGSYEMQIEVNANVLQWSVRIEERT